jgi:pimeloyl-ACP methyl ester carboxylesterase
MSAFVLIPGAGGAAWYWAPGPARAAGRGHEGIAVDLPGPDESAGLRSFCSGQTIKHIEQSTVTLCRHSYQPEDQHHWDAEAMAGSLDQIQ